MANEIIRPTQLPARADPVASEVVPSDNGSVVGGVAWADGVNAAVPPASQPEAEAGVINTKRMTPLTTKQAIDAQVPAIVSNAIASLNLDTMSQESANDYTKTIDLAAVATSNNYADLENKPTLGTAAATDAAAYATAAQGGLADTAVQPSDLANVATSGDYQDLLNKPTARLLPAGGLTSQSLVKSSDADFDTEWVTSAAATAVSYAPQTLTPAQKGQARANIDAGVLAGFRNKLINGDFEIWQRGTSHNTGGYGSVDRWRLAAAGNQGVVSRIALDGAASASVPGEPRYAARLSASAVLTADTRLVQHVESARTLVGKTGTLSGYIRGSTDQLVLVEVFQSFGSGGSPSPSQGVGSQTITLAPGFTRFDIVMDFPSVAGKTFGSNDDDFLIVRFTLPSGTASGQFFDLARASLVEGDATAEEDPFSPRHIQQELSLCQRYCFVPTNDGPQQFATGFVRNPNTVRAIVQHPVQMYKTPTAIITNPTTGFAVHAGSTSVTASGMSAESGVDRTNLDATTPALTAGFGAQIVFNTGTIIMDAEI